MICIASPIRYAGKVSSKIKFISNPFCSACFSPISMTSSNSCKSSYLPSSISDLPDSILEISSTLLISEIKYPPERSILLAYCRISSFSLSLKIISFIPSITLIGVLISWLIFARKALLALLADCASILASSKIFCCLLYILKCRYIASATETVDAQNPIRTSAMTSFSEENHMTVCGL